MPAPVLSNLIGMGKSPLILAALAKGAAPGLNFVKVQKSSLLQNNDFDDALLTTDEGKHYIVRIAKTATAATKQETELRALKALTKNSDLGFAVSSQHSSTTTRDGEVVRVLNYVYGSNFDLAEIRADDPLVESTAKALASIHNLPLSVVQDIDFPEYTTSNILTSLASDLDRAMATGKVPSVMLNRWEDALGNENLFRFMPTVINGILSPESVLELDGEISGILDWMDLQIGDPARDFGWILARGHDDLVYNLMLAYQQARPSADDNIRQRAKLYSELAWASYLVTAVNSGNESDILDAQGEIDLLAAEVEAGTALRLTPTAFAPQVVQTSFEDGDSSDFVEPAEPIYVSTNYDKPLVDFALSGSVAEAPQPQANFDDTATAPIEIVEAADEATSTAETILEKQQDSDLPPFLTGELPGFLIDEELDSNSKDELF